MIYTMYMSLLLRPKSIIGGKDRRQNFTEKSIDVLIGLARKFAKILKIGIRSGVRCHGTISVHY
jgi:hypothetical protein